MSSALRLSARRPLASLSHFRAVAQPARRCYPGSKEPSGDYGSGTGDPRGEKPLDQGPNPSADKEHPGPPPPKAGEGSGTGTKSHSDGHESTGQQKRSFSTMRVFSGAGVRSFGTMRRLGATVDGAPEPGERPKSSEGLSPKIHDGKQDGTDMGESEEVKKHNEELAQRAEKAHEKSPGDEDKDKVSKGFWKGHGGADRDP